MGERECRSGFCICALALRSLATKPALLELQRLEVPQLRVQKLNVKGDVG